MFITTADNKIYANAPGVFIDKFEDLKSEAQQSHLTWAEDSVTDNDAIGWIMANYIEADKPNANRHMWTFEDLLEAQHTIKYSPMNVLHNAKNIVGVWVDQNMIYPVADAGGIEHPYIEVLGAFWLGLNPDLAQLVQKYYSEGSLFVSMECIAETITISADERQETYAYKGPTHESYGDIQNIPGAISQLNKPTFIGGALIFPPANPGWRGANVTALACEILGEDKVAEIKEGITASMAADTEDSVIEDLTADFIMKRFTTVADLISEEDTDSEDKIDEEKENSLINAANEPMNDTTDTIDDPQGGVEVMNELETANATIAELIAKVADLEAAATAQADNDKLSELEASHAASLEEGQAKLDAVKAELDVATAKAEASETKYDELVSFLDAEVAAAEQAASAEARKEERVTAIKAVASVSDEYVAKRADEWSALSDEAFASLVDDLKAVAVAKPETSSDDSNDDSVPATTAMATGDTDTDDNQTSYGKAFDMIRSGADPRSIR
jgi:hypothetical protein